MELSRPLDYPGYFLKLWCQPITLALLARWGPTQIGAFVPTCAFCKAEETELYENGVPICLQCAQRRNPNPPPPPKNDPPRQPDV